MAHGPDVPPPGIELKGLAKHFNSWTMYGRRNVTILTYSVIGSIFLYRYIAKKFRKEQPKK